MKFSLVLKSLFLLLLLNCSSKTYAQCFEIESILIDACGSGATTNDEGLNEMVRFKVGPVAINTSSINVVWPNTANSWTGLIQDGTTSSKVNTLNLGISGVIKDEESMKTLKEDKRRMGETILVQVVGFEKANNVVLKYVE